MTRAWLRRQEWYGPLWQPEKGQERWMHIYLMILQSQSLAGVHGRIHGNMDRAPFQTNAPIRNPLITVFLSPHPDGLTRHMHGRSQSHAHTSMVACSVLFLETWPWYQGTPMDLWCPHRAWHCTSYSWPALFCTDRAGPLICIWYSSYLQWSRHTCHPHSSDQEAIWVSDFLALG